MKPYLAISVALHAALIVGLFFSSSRSTRGNTYPQVYRVNLVGGAAAPPPARVKSVAVETFARQPVKIEPRPKGLVAQEKTTKNIKKPSASRRKTKGETKPAVKKEQTSDYPEFLDDIDFGSEFGGIRIDAANFQSSYYINLIFGKIRSRWSNPVKQSDILETTVYFRVGANGRISRAEIESRSGLDAFDQSALRAILTSDPLPPLPQEFSGDDIGIHLKFEYTP